MMFPYLQKRFPNLTLYRNGGTMTAQSDALMLVEKIRWLENEVDRARTDMKERCAQIADRLASSKEIARRIRALPDKP